LALFINRNGYLYSIDTRVKWAGVFIIVFIVLSIPIFAWAVYILLLSILIAVSMASQLPVRQILQRTLLVEIPLLFVLIPLPFIKHELPVITLSMLGLSLNISLTELLRVGVLILRSWLIIFAMVLFTMTTPADEMLSSLSTMGVPAVLVNIILLMWRYLALFTRQAQAMSAARELRSIPLANGVKRKTALIFWNFRCTGSMIGSLFVRAYERSDRIYQAMVLRGFDGTVRSIQYEPLHKPQIVQILFMLFLGFCFIIGSYGIYGN